MAIAPLSVLRGTTKTFTITVTGIDLTALDQYWVFIYNTDKDVIAQFVSQTETGFEEVEPVVGEPTKFKFTLSNVQTDVEPGIYLIEIKSIGGGAYAGCKPKPFMEIIDTVGHDTVLE